MSFPIRFLLSVAYVAVVGILSNIIGERVPRRWFRYDNFWFHTRPWEREGKIYEKVGVHKWKDHAPDMSKINKKMVLKKVGLAPSAERVERLVTETCVAEATHAILCLLGIGIFFFWMSPIGIVFSALDILCNIPFIIIQRYNRPKLVSLAKRLALREERKKNATADFVGEHGGRS